MKLNVQYITNEHGERSAVILPIADFQALLEDLEDMAATVERRSELSVAHEDLKEELKLDDLLPD